MNKMKIEYQEMFEDYVKKVMDVYEAVGVAVCIVDKKGSIYEKYFGYKDYEKKQLIDADTIFGLASVTKSFTCLSIMQLAKKGIINIDDPVSKYIPEYKNIGQETVKIHHLMSHCAGYYPLPRITVEEIANNLGLTEKDGDYAYNEELAIAGIKLVANRMDKQDKFVGKPGEYTSYSNDGYALLSDIIRRYGGEKSYAQYVNKNILEPLDMNRSGCEFIKPREDNNKATLYIHKDDIRTSTDNYYDNAFVLMGGGAMKSTINDMKKYVQMFLNGGVGNNKNRILDRYSIKEMMKPRQFFKFQQMYGYGLSSRYLGDITIVEHGGSLTGVSSNMSFSEELGLGVIVLCNTSGVPVANICTSALKWFNGKNPIEQSDIFDDCKWDEDTINKAVGTYISGEGAIVVISKNDNGILINSDGINMNTRMVQPKLAIVSDKLSSVDVRLYMDDNDEVFAVGYGTRIIPRVK